MLTAWALKFRGLKKRVAWHLYQQHDLRSAQVLHATSQDEAEGFRALGLTQPIAVIPNGVEAPSAVRRAPSAKRQAQCEERHAPGATRTALFLSRIHPKKGLIDLVRAWGALSAERQAPGAMRHAQSAWRVVIAGGDENGHLAEVKTEIRKLKLENCFEFVGEVAGDRKWELYRQADLFVLPTYSENFGIVIAEALACGVPVITTKGTPWQELQTHRCGWWVEVGAEALLGALRLALSASPEERREMGERGRALVKSKYTWPAVAAQMKSVYEWVLDLGPKPECVSVLR
jgi:glycosyltransferase involved in cell wall biosynthesis